MGHSSVHKTQNRPSSCTTIPNAPLLTQLSPPLPVISWRAVPVKTTQSGEGELTRIKLLRVAVGRALTLLWGGMLGLLHGGDERRPCLHGSEEEALPS